VEGVSTWSRNQSHERRGYLPGVGVNHMWGGGIYLPGAGTSHMRGVGIYLEQEPIILSEGVSTWSRNQTYEEREYLPD